jgi:hypothetical protein
LTGSWTRVKIINASPDKCPDWRRNCPFESNWLATKPAGDNQQTKPD